MSKLIVFDVDGTLINSWRGFEKTLLEYSHAQGLPRPCLETIKKGYGHPHDHDFGWGVDRDEQFRHLQGCWDLGKKYEMSNDPVHTPYPFEGVEEVLVHLKDTGHTLAVVTSKPEDPFLHLMDYHNMGHYFSARRVIDDVERRGEKEKPAPDMLQSVMRELKFAPDETVMIGDTTMDIRMGRAALAHTIGVTWGNHSKTLLVDAGAHHIVETEVNALVPVIKKIFGAT